MLDLPASAITVAFVDSLLAALFVSTLYAGKRGGTLFPPSCYKDGPGTASS